MKNTTKRIVAAAMSAAMIAAFSPVAAFADDAVTPIAETNDGAAIAAADGEEQLEDDVTNSTVTFCFASNYAKKVNGKKKTTVTVKWRPMANVENYKLTYRVAQKSGKSYGKWSKKTTLTVKDIITTFDDQPCVSKTFSVTKKNAVKVEVSVVANINGQTTKADPIVIFGGKTKWTEEGSTKAINMQKVTVNTTPVVVPANDEKTEFFTNTGVSVSFAYLVNNESYQIKSRYYIVGEGKWSSWTTENVNADKIALPAENSDGLTSYVLTKGVAEKKSGPAHYQVMIRAIAGNSASPWYIAESLEYTE